MKHKAGILLYRKSDGAIQVLLVNDGKKWSIPKGSIQPAESRRRAAIRELFEETELKAPEQLDEIGYVDNSRAERLFCFLGKVEKKCNPKASAEISQAVFVELKVARNCIDPYQRPLLDTLQGLNFT